MMLKAVSIVSGVLFIIAQNVWALPEFQGKVVGVHDGDTLTVLTPEKKQYKIRMAEIDAPESRQDYGTRAQQALSAMVFSREVTVLPEETDRYGRTVAHIIVDNQDVNRRMVEQGAAWVYRAYLKDQSLIDIETDARTNKRGLWGVGTPVPPWEWRKGFKTKNATKVIPPIASTPIIAPRTERKGSYAGCGSKWKCGQMDSCKEAYHYLNNCGKSRLDGDHDGVPCESLCR